MDIPDNSESTEKELLRRLKIYAVRDAIATMRGALDIMERDLIGAATTVKSQRTSAKQIIPTTRAEKIALAKQLHEEGQLRDYKIAERCGVTGGTFSQWKKNGFILTDKKGGFKRAYTDEQQQDVLKLAAENRYSNGEIAEMTKLKAHQVDYIRKKAAREAAQAT